MVFDTKFYDILKIPTSASATAIDEAYYDLKLDYQFDSTADGTKKLEELNKAYNILRDTEKRKHYDLHGYTETNQTTTNTNQTATNTNQTTANTNQTTTTTTTNQTTTNGKRGANLVHKLPLDLGDFYFGKKKKLAINRKILCPECTDKNGVLNCTQCLGKKVISDRKIIEFFIEPGARAGQQFVFTGESDQAPNVPPGDIIIQLEQKTHPHFTRKGDDLYYETKINLLMALAGGQFAIPHLDDRFLLVTVLPGETIKPNIIKVIPYEGMPMFRIDNRGHLFVKFDIEITNVDWNDKQVRKQLANIVPPVTIPPEYKEWFIEEDVDMEDFGPYKERFKKSAKEQEDREKEKERGTEEESKPRVECTTQ